MSERRTSRTDYTVLGCLSLGVMSGYDIKQLIDSSIHHFWSESYGQIYPSLRRLEGDGLIEPVGTEATSSRGRRAYRLTAAGLRVLREWLAEPAQHDVVRYETSLKLFFGAQMDPREAMSHVRRYREQQVRLLEGYGAAADRIADRGGAARPYWEAVLDGGQRYSRMVIEWCDATLERLEQIDPDHYPAGAPGLGDQREEGRPAGGADSP